jgi:DNA-binding CsgD family transcriptional regulator
MMAQSVEILALSPRPVLRAFGAIFTKLGIQSRVQLANQLHDQREMTG